MADGIIRTDIEGVSFERGNGKFAAVFPDGSHIDFDMESIRQEIKSTLLVLEELQNGFDVLEQEQKRAERLAKAGLGDEFIEFNDEARDTLIDDIVNRVESVIEDGMANHLKASYLIGDVIDAIADVVVEFGR